VPRLAGEIRAPGDKSCSHRAFLLGAVAAGRTDITAVLEGEDVLNTARACAALGAEVTRIGVGAWTVLGVGARGFTSPAGVLDFGNAGTGSRLMMGLAGGYPVEATFDGDASLRSRPMERVLKPLRQMGVEATTAEGGRLPVVLKGGRLKAIRYAPPVASAQVKSAVLLAGLNADGVTEVAEAKFTRDHTERMLTGFGAEVATALTANGGAVIRLAGGQRLTGQAVVVPGDPSSAAFALAAGVIAAAGQTQVVGVMSNPTRTGFMTALQAMGADLSWDPDTASTGRGEATGRWTARASSLRGINLDPALVPSMIDELPILAVCAAFATGDTRVTGAEELRVKESDRIRATVALLRANGVQAEELPDGFVVQGCGPGGVPGGGLVETRHDHRIAMSGLVMGMAAKRAVTVDDTTMIATSYPSFLADMAALGADIRVS
jgi:3-phosphoshikimate 1-carboxyvinyltransferase